MESTFNIELRDIDSITPYENNPRLNDGAVDAVAASLEQFGFRQPIVVDADGVIIAGHTRFKAAKKLGLTKVPVHVAVDLSPEQVKAYRLADNKTGELAEWDLNILPIELAELRDAGFDMSLLAFDEKELASLLTMQVQSGHCDPDHVPEPPDEPITQKGDLWILDDHRLLCGDSASVSDVDYLIDGSVIQATICDPPYNVRVESRSKNSIAAGLSTFTPTHHQQFDAARLGNVEPTTQKLRPKDRPLENDFVSDEEFDRLLDDWFGNIARVMQPGGAFYIWGGYANFVNYPGFLKKHNLYFSQAIVWLKDHPVLTRKDFLGDHEWCFYGWKLGAGHKFYGPNNITDTWKLSRDHNGNCAIGSGVRLNFPDGSRLDVLPPSDKHRVREVELKEDSVNLIGMNAVTDVWRVKKVNPQQMVHLTEKPVELGVRAIGYSTQAGENVLELFGGSGSTLIACEMTGRKCFAMEIDRWYADVIVQRWQEFTGRKAELVRRNNVNNG